jgi:hypothetical protein
MIQALDDLGYTPERDPKKFKKKEQDRKDAIRDPKMLKIGSLLQRQ